MHVIDILYLGMSYDFEVTNGRDNDSYGLSTCDGWMVKGSVYSDGNEHTNGFLLSRSEGYNFYNTFVSARNLSQTLVDGVSID